MLTDVSRGKLILTGRGIEVATLDWGGSGPLTILSHANGFCAGVWALIAERLRSEYRVVAFDARGHGDSSKPPPATGYDWSEFTDDLIAVAEILVAESGPAYGIGHSFGGTVTLAAAAQRPELFSQIAMIDPVLIRPDFQLTEERSERTSAIAEIARKRRQIWPSRQTARDSWRNREPFDSWDPDSLDLYLDEGMLDREDGRVELKCSGEIEAAIYAMSASLPIFDAAAALAAPALLLFAARGVFPREICEELARRAESLQIEDIEAGHLMPMEVPALIASQLLRFGAER